MITVPVLFLLSTPLAAGSRVFEVFHNKLDPTVFNISGGAHLVNVRPPLRDVGAVEACTICVRFQV